MVPCGEDMLITSRKQLLHENWVIVHQLSKIVMRHSWQTLLQKYNKEATPSDLVSDDVTELPTSSNKSPPDLPVT